MATEPPRETEPETTPDSLPPPPERPVEPADPAEPDEGVEHIEEEGEPFPGNFA